MARFSDCSKYLLRGNIIIRKRILIIFFISGIVLSAEDLTPVITENEIVFSETQNTYDLQSNWGPYIKNNSGIKFYREKVIVNESESLIIIFQDFRLDEGSAAKLVIFNFLGNLISETEIYSGRYDVILLEEFDFLFLISKLSTHLSKSSYILSTKGVFIKEFEHAPEIVKSGVTSDSNYIWLISRIPIQLNNNQIKPGNFIELFNYMGEKVFEETSTDSGKHTIQIDGKSYEIILPRPELPG